MKYGDLSRRRQLARTRDVARNVVARYIHGGYRLRLLAHTDNTSYHVTPSHTGDSYVLRLAGKPAPEVESEIAWLRALADAGYPVPNPLVTLDGSRVVPVTIPGTDATRTASLWRWVAGRAVGVNASPSVAWRLGVLVARLHSHAERFAVPAGFRRPVMDTDGLFEALPDFCRERGRSLLTRQDVEVVSRAVERNRREISTLTPQAAAFGLIHADLNPWNVLHHDGALHVIDFDDCGFGYFLYDLAVPLVEWDRREDGERRQALLAGYASIRGSAEFRNLDTFVTARRLALLPWLTRVADVPSLGTWARSRLRAFIASLASH